MSVGICTSLLNAVNPYKHPNNEPNNDNTRIYHDNYLKILLSFLNLKLNIKDQKIFLDGVNVSGSIYTCVAMHLYDDKFNKAVFLRELVANYILSLNESYFSDIMESIHPLFLRSDPNFSLQSYAQTVRSGVEDFLQVGILGKLCKLSIFVVFADYPLPFGWHEATDLNQCDAPEPLWICYSFQDGFQRLKTRISNPGMRIDQNILYELKKKNPHNLLSSMSESVLQPIRPAISVRNTPKDELYLGLNVQLKLLKFYTSSLNSVENGFFTGILDSIQGYIKKLESKHKLLNRVAFISPPGLKKLINYVLPIHILGSAEYKELFNRNTLNFEKQGYFKYESKVSKPSWTKKLYWKAENCDLTSYIVVSTQSQLQDHSNFVKVKVPKQLQCSVSLRFGRVGIKVKFLSWNHFGILYQSYLVNNCFSSMFESLMIRPADLIVNDSGDCINYLDAEIENLIGTSVEWIPPTQNLNSALDSIQQYMNKLAKNFKISCLISHIQITLPNLITKIHGEIIELSSSPLFSEKCQKFTSKVSAVVLQLQNHSRMCEWACNTLPRMLSISFYNTLLDPNASSKIAFFVTSPKDIESSEMEKIVHSLNFSFNTNPKLNYESFGMPKGADSNCTESFNVGRANNTKFQKLSLYNFSDKFSPESKNVSQLVHFLLKFLWSDEGLSTDRLFVYNHIIVPLMSRIKIHQLRIIDGIEAMKKRGETHMTQQFFSDVPKSVGKAFENLELLKPSPFKEFYSNFTNKVKKWSQNLFHIVDQYKEKLYRILNDEDDYPSIVWLHNYLLTLCELYNSPMPLVINYLIQPPLNLDPVGLENLLCGFIITNIKSNFELAIKDMYEFLIREAFTELIALIGNYFIPSTKVEENLYISSELQSLQGVMGNMLLKFSAPSFEKIEKKIRNSFKPLLNSFAANIRNLCGVLAPNSIFRHFIVVEYPDLKAQAFKIGLEIWERKLRDFVENYLKCVQLHIPNAIQKFLSQLELAYIKYPKFEIKSPSINNNFPDLIIKLIESEIYEVLDLANGYFDKYSEDILNQNAESKSFEELLELMNNGNSGGNNQNKSDHQTTRKDSMKDSSLSHSHGMTYTSAIIHSIFQLVRRMIIEVDDWADSNAVEQKIINHFRFQKYEHQQIILSFFSMISDMLKIAQGNGSSSSSCCSINRRFIGNSVYFYFSSITTQWLPEEDIALLFMTISHIWTETHDSELELLQFSYSFLFEAARSIVRSKICRSIWEIRDRLMLHYKRFGCFERALEFFFHKQPVLEDLCNFFKFGSVSPISNNLRKCINSVSSRLGLENADVDQFWFLLKKTLQQVRLEHPQANLDDILFVLRTSQNQRKKELDDEENGMTLLAYLYTGLQNSKEDSTDSQVHDVPMPSQMDTLANSNPNLLASDFQHGSNSISSESYENAELMNLDLERDLPVQDPFMKRKKQVAELSRMYPVDVTQPYPAIMNPGPYSLVVTDIDSDPNFLRYILDYKICESNAKCVGQQQQVVYDPICPDKAQEFLAHRKLPHDVMPFNNFEKGNCAKNSKNPAYEEYSVKPLPQSKLDPSENLCKFEKNELVEKSQSSSTSRHLRSKFQESKGESQKWSMHVSNCAKRGVDNLSKTSDSIYSKTPKSDPSLFHSMKDDLSEEKLGFVGRGSSAGCKPRSRARKSKKKQTYVYSDQEDDAYEDEDMDYLIHSDCKGSSMYQEKSPHSLDSNMNQSRPYRKRRKFDCSLVDLIKLGYLHVGDTVAAFKQTGTVVSEGLAFKDLIYDNPSAFAARCLAENAAKIDPQKKVVSNYNGWDYVKYRGKKLGYWRSLCSYEAGFQTKKSLGEPKSSQ